MDGCLDGHSCLNTVIFIRERSFLFQAKQKANAIVEKIGYPSWIMNATALSEYYQGLVIGRTHFLNRVSYFQYDYNKNNALLCQAVDRTVYDLIILLSCD